MLPQMIYSKNQKVGGSTVYDALELSFHTGDKPSLFKHTNIHILQSINHEDLASDVYNKNDVDSGQQS